MQVNENLVAPLQVREYQAIAEEAVTVAAGGAILDWGCGEGQVSQEMTSRGGRVTACDFDPEADGVERGVPFARYPDLTADRSADPVAIPYDDESFDVALSCGVLEHVSEPLASLQELRRVLRPGGRLLVFKLPNRLSVLEFVAQATGLPYHGMRVHDTLWGVRSTRWALEAAGFDVDDVRRQNLLPLTVDHPVLRKNAPGLWRLNERLSRNRVTGLGATNIEARATKPVGVRRREIVS